MTLIFCVLPLLGLRYDRIMEVNGGRMKNFALVVVVAIVVAWLSGCSVVGHERVEGWPKLAVVEHHVAEAQMRDVCNKYVPFGFVPMACAEFDLAKRECHLWFSSDFPPTSSLREHELLHCEGYDHIGGTTLRELLEAHR